MLLTRSQIIKSFVGEQCTGNAHQIIEMPETEFDENLERLCELSWELGPTILVILDINSMYSGSRITAKFIHNGQPVAFCGSGLLATMHYLELERGVQFDEESKIRFEVNGQDVYLGKKNDQYFLSLNADFQAMPFDLQEVEAVLGVKVVSAEELPSGYIIAEIECAERLAKLTPDLETIKLRFKPSLIVTAPGSEKISEDYAMRYFAPQYGNPEDAATGSANAYLMKYWRDKLNKNELVGRQLSAEGGLFYGSVDGSKVTLSGITQ